MPARSGTDELEGSILSGFDSFWICLNSERSDVCVYFDSGVLGVAG